MKHGALIAPVSVEVAVPVRLSAVPWIPAPKVEVAEAVSVVVAVPPFPSERTVPDALPKFMRPVIVDDALEIKPGVVRYEPLNKNVEPDVMRVPSKYITPLFV